MGWSRGKGQALQGLLIAGMLAACGGGGGGSPVPVSVTPPPATPPVSTPSPAPVVVSGIAATGAAAANFDVSVACTKGSAVTKTDSSGAYSVSGIGDAPCLVTASSAAGVTPRISLRGIALSAGTNLMRGNVTPLTEAIVQIVEARGRIGDANAVPISSDNFRSLLTAHPELSNPQTFVSAQTVLVQSLGANVGNTGVSVPAGTDLLTAPFKAATAASPGDSVDKILDGLRASGVIDASGLAAQNNTVLGREAVTALATQITYGTAGPIPLPVPTPTTPDPAPPTTPTPPTPTPPVTPPATPPVTTPPVTTPPVTSTPTPTEPELTVQLDQNPGTQAAPTAWSGAGVRATFTEDINVASYAVISNFGANDRLSLPAAARNLMAVASQGSNVILTVNKGGVVSSIVLANVVSADSIVYDLASFNALPVGDIAFDAVDAGKTATLDGLGGTLSAPASIDTGSGAFVLTDDALLSSNVLISNFGADDVLQWKNVAANAVAVSTKGRDVTLTANRNGTVSSVTLVNAVPAGAIVFDIDSFNALKLGRVQFL
jgi:hypothetical protein